MKKQLISYILVLTMLVSILFKGTVTNVDAKKASITKKKITMTVGQKKVIKLKGKTKIKWKTSNKKVVTVNKEGAIKAKKVGKAKITASFSDKKIQYIVRVNKKKDDPSATPAPHPSRRNRLTGGRFVYGSGYIIKKIVPKDAETSYVYMTRNPKVDDSGIVIDNQVLKKF